MLQVDVRQWVLVTDVNPITIWFFRPAYVRFCATNYDLSTLEDRCVAAAPQPYLRHGVLANGK